MRRALIFGSTGHIGRALAGRLAAAGVEIVGSARPGAADAPDPRSEERRVGKECRL